MPEGEEPRSDAVCGEQGCYYGYSIELLNELAKNLKFTYKIYEVADGKYGRKDEVTGKWNGLVAELIEDDAGRTV